MTATNDQPQNHLNVMKIRWGCILAAILAAGSVVLVGIVAICLACNLLDVKGAAMMLSFSIPIAAAAVSAYVFTVKPIRDPNSIRGAIVVWVLSLVPLLIVYGTESTVGGSAVIGLLGAIAGYLLSDMTKARESEE